MCVCLCAWLFVCVFVCVVVCVFGSGAACGCVSLVVCELYCRFSAVLRVQPAELAGPAEKTVLSFGGCVVVERGTRIVLEGVAMADPPDIVYSAERGSKVKEPNATETRSTEPFSHGRELLSAAVEFQPTFNINLTNI